MQIQLRDYDMWMCLSTADPEKKRNVGKEQTVEIIRSSFFNFHIDGR